jgi:hypothetical protein
MERSRSYEAPHYASSFSRFEPVVSVLRKFVSRSLEFCPSDVYMTNWDVSIDVPFKLHVSFIMAIIKSYKQ